MDADWFAGRLKELREGAGLTQPELAERAGMNRFGIAKLEQGVTKPTWETVIALCKALGVDCNAFTRPPVDREPTGRGRPAKPKDESPEPKRPRGRPRKDDIRQRKDK
jgi:transcriptional regulator with XRE-family HTH domain